MGGHSRQTRDSEVCRGTITTSDFSSEAEVYVSRIDKKIILIDGQTMARLMIDFGVGVASVSTYEVKKLDSDYFETT